MKWKWSRRFEAEPSLASSAPVGCDLMRRLDRPDIKFRNIARPSCQDQTEIICSGQPFCSDLPLGAPGDDKGEKQQVIVTLAATKYIRVGAGRVVANLGGIFLSKNQGKAGHFHHGLTLSYRCSDRRRLSLSLASIELCSTSLS